MSAAFVRRFFLAATLGALATPPARAELRILASPGGQVGPFLDLFAFFLLPLWEKVARSAG